MNIVRRTRLHEVALWTVGAVVEDVVLHVVVLVVAATNKRLACSLSAVVVAVGLLDPAVDEKAQHVRSEIQRQHDEVEQIVVVEQVDAYSWVVHLFALDPQQTCSPPHHTAADSSREMPDLLVFLADGLAYAVITIAIRLRYDYDPTTTYRAPASIRRDSTRAKNDHVNFSS